VDSEEQKYISQNDKLNEGGSTPFSMYFRAKSGTLMTLIREADTLN
jgi:hypothetical protein